MDLVIHSALVGGSWSAVTAAEFEAVNYQGTINVADEAAAAGIERTIMVSTKALLNLAFVFPFTGSLLIALRGELKRGVRP